MRTSLNFSDELASMRCSLPEEQWKVKFKVDPGDLGRIWVLDPRSKSFVEVPAVHQDYAAGLSLWNHKVIRRYARMHRGAKSHADLVEAKADLRKMVEDRAIRTNRKRAESPQKVARFLSGDTPSATFDRIEQLSESTDGAVRASVIQTTTEDSLSGTGQSQEETKQFPQPRMRVDGKSNAMPKPPNRGEGSSMMDDDLDEEFRGFEVEVG